VLCTVESVRVHVLTGQHVVLLQPKDSDRLVPIWIGADQAHSIATRIAGIPSDRPLTHDLMMSMLAASGAEITRVVVKDLVTDASGQGSIFHGSVFLQVGEREVEIDSRASDAIALAVRCDARILVSEGIVDRASIGASGEEDEATSELGVFRQFIESLPDEPARDPRDRPDDPTKGNS
jgi:bifunctional DNase/RNase